jgi:hypothetical protein
MADADDYTALYGPFAGKGGVLVPTVAVRTFLSLCERSFDFRLHNQDGVKFVGEDPVKLIVTPPRDDDGQAVQLSFEEREIIKRYRLHFIVMATACDAENPWPLRSATG